MDLQLDRSSCFLLFFSQFTSLTNMKVYFSLPCPVCVSSAQLQRSSITLNPWISCFTYETHVLMFLSIICHVKTSDFHTVIESESESVRPGYVKLTQSVIPTWRPVEEVVLASSFLCKGLDGSIVVSWNDLVQSNNNVWDKNLDDALSLGCCYRYHSEDGMGSRQPSLHNTFMSLLSVEFLGSCYII